MLKVARLISVVFFFSMSISLITAQTGTSNINGRVVDVKEAFLCGAHFTLTNEATGVTQTQTTSHSGI